MDQQRKIKLVVSYDGSAYHGWQRQKKEIITVQQVLEETAARTFKHRITIRGSGRTDTGVHAAGQVASFYTNTRIPNEKIAHTLNHRLPGDIRIVSARQVPDHFDPIGSAQSKLYRYRIFNHSDLPPGQIRYCYHYYLACQIEPMRQAAKLLLGEHDFVSFSTANHGRSNTVRNLIRCHIEKKCHWLDFYLEANGFLYNMVRNIVGTLLDVGRGFRSPESVAEILAACDRQAAGPKAPPNGLTLMWVRYPHESTQTEPDQP